MTDNICFYFLILFFGFIVIALFIRKNWLKVIFVNLSILFLFVSLLEFGLDKNQFLSRIFQLENKWTLSGSYTKNYMNYFKGIGYGPSGSKSVTSIKKDKDSNIIYDVKYSIGDHFNRQVINAPDNSDISLIFGGSFAFGEGITDGNTFADSLQSKLLEKRNVYNLAFHGYGPHHMLWRLENNFKLDFIDSKNVKEVLYFSIYDHIFRSIGFSKWDMRGPNYKIVENNILKYKGPFYSDRSIKIIESLRKSNIFSVFEDIYWGFQRNNTEDHERALKTFVKIVQKAKDISESRWNARFVVILWWYEDEKVNRVEKKLNDLNIKYISLSKLIKNFDSRRDLHIIGDETGKKGDPKRYRKAHPNEKSQKILSDIIYNQFFKSEL